MGPEAAARVREANLKWLVDHGVEFVQTNVISAVTTRAKTPRAAMESATL